jgi:hypothetical protein
VSDERPVLNIAVLTDLADKIESWPEQHATRSRDYGRGYAQAIRDVQAALRGAHEVITAPLRQSAPSAPDGENQ